MLLRAPCSAGKGAYGTVYKAIDRLSHQPVAIKVIPLTEQDKEDFKQIQKEIAFLADCNHPNVVRYLVRGAGRAGWPRGRRHVCRRMQPEPAVARQQMRPALPVPNCTGGTNGVRTLPGAVARSTNSSCPLVQIM